MRILGKYPLIDLSRAENQWIGQCLQSRSLLNSFIPAGLRTTAPKDRFGGWSIRNRTVGLQRRIEIAVMG